MSGKPGLLHVLAASSALFLAAGAADAQQTTFGTAAPAPRANPAYDPSWNFDVLHPFAKVRTGDEWLAKFVSGKPNVVPGDAYGNMGSQQFADLSWWGQNIGHPENTISGAKGNGGSGVNMKSPYPFKTAEEHYKAWRAAAGGGTRPTDAQLPDWSGDWAGAAQGVFSGRAKVSDVMDATSDAYKPRYRRLLEAEWAGHPWWASQYCFPVGGPAFWAGHAGGVYHFMHDKSMVLAIKDKNIGDSRYLYTDGRGWLPEDRAVPQWYGASQAFWDGDELVVWTGQMRGWVFSHGIGEYSDKMQTVERYKRFGDEFVVDITAYDPEAFAYPWHDVALFKPVKDWTLRPMMFLDCPSTNNVFLNRYGELDDRQAGDSGYIDLTDARPWETAYKLWDEMHNKDGSRKTDAQLKQQAAAKPNAGVQQARLKP